MKRGYFILIALFACILYGHAQSEMDYILNGEGKLTAIPRYKTFELKMPKYSYLSYTPSSMLSIDSKLRQFHPDITTTGLDERPMDMQVLSEAYKPFFNVFSPMLRRVSPMAFDFSETSVTPISETTAFVVNGQQYSWPGAGGLTTVSPTLVWRQDKWTLSGGAFAGRFFTPFNYSPGYMGGVNAMASYEATDWLTVKAWGQYAQYGKDEKYNPHMLLNPFYNHTNVGGSMEFKITENFGIGMGVNVEYNPWNRKMEPQYLVYPVFKSGRFKGGISGIEIGR